MQAEAWPASPPVRRATGALYFFLQCLRMSAAGAAGTDSGSWSCRGHLAKPAAFSVKVRARTTLRPALLPQEHQLWIGRPVLESGLGIVVKSREGPLATTPLGRPELRGQTSPLTIKAWRGPFAIETHGTPRRAPACTNPVRARFRASDSADPFGGEGSPVAARMPSGPVRGGVSRMVKGERACGPGWGTGFRVGKSLRAWPFCGPADTRHWLAMRRPARH